MNIDELEETYSFRAKQ